MYPRRVLGTRASDLCSPVEYQKNKKNDEQCFNFSSDLTGTQQRALKMTALITGDFVQ